MIGYDVLLGLTSLQVHTLRCHSSFISTFISLPILT